MRDRSSDPRRLDLQSFAHDAGSLQGAWPLGSFARLSTSLLADAKDDARAADWSAAGIERQATGAPPQTWLHLKASLEVTLQCQRCLQPMTGRLTIDRHFRFVADAALADRLDEESEEDVLMLERQHDLHELLEDELILALPIVPRHESCPQPLSQALPSAANDGAEERPNPFAVLAALRSDGKPN